MARYEHLPIYKAAMDWTVYLEQVVRNFSRCHKYTLGSDLRQQSRELVMLIIRANSRADKVPVLHDLRERLEALQVLLRIGKEVKAFQKFNSYAHAAELVVALSRQNEGWMKGQSVQKRSSPQVVGGDLSEESADGFPITNVRNDGEERWISTTIRTSSMVGELLIRDRTKGRGW